MSLFGVKTYEQKHFISSKKEDCKTKTVLGEHKLQFWKTDIWEILTHGKNKMF